MSAKKGTAKKATKKAAKKAAKKTSNRISPPNQSPPATKDVVALATSLVSAQIMASSYHETAMGLSQEIRQLAVDAMESIQDIRQLGAPENDSPALKQSLEFMNKVRMERRRSRSPKLLVPMSHPDLDRLFQSAMRRAFVMLNAPFDPERIVFAEQIFRPHEILTEGAIRGRFIDFKWPGLKSGAPVTRLIQDANRWFTAHLVELRSAYQQESGFNSVSATDPEIPIRVRIESEVEKLTWLLQQTSEAESLSPEIRSSYRDLSSALSDFVRSRDGIDLGGAFRKFDAIERNNLIMVMFGDHGPQSVDAADRVESHVNSQEGSSDMSEASSPKYRPWAIFRYLRRHGRDELGIDLNNRLRSKRSDLNRALIPDIPGIRPASFEFGPLREEAEDLLNQLQDEDGYSDSAMTSDELALHGFDPADIADAASEFDSRDNDSQEGIPRF